MPGIRSFFKKIPGVIRKYRSTCTCTSQLHVIKEKFVSNGIVDKV